jgi:hypothetical protein
LSDTGSEILDDFLAAGGRLFPRFVREGVFKEGEFASGEATEGGVTHESVFGMAREKVEHDAFDGVGADFAEGEHDLELDVETRVFG